MNFKTINKNNGTVEGFCLVKTLEVKKTAKGLTYLDMTLTDSTGEINAKLWDYKEELHSDVKVNTIVKVRGTESIFNDAPQLRVDRIRKALEADNVKAEDFVPSSEYSGETMFDTIFAVAESFENEELKLLVTTILSENKEQLVICPAAYKLHHAIRGGLMYHTLSVLRLAESVCAIYPSVDKELLLSGVILHDVAKIWEFDVSEAGIVSGYSVEGSLIGHLVKGAMNVDKVGERLGTDKNLLMLLEHMIISHHGEPEFGAAVRPMFLEAELLSQLDTMDARIYEISFALSEVESGTFTPRQWALDNRKLYNTGIKEVNAKADLL
ncbi:MAG: HD domain-containing protein [Clostridia bacterium]|nr:HD domain-containing protein [Clostridia bacterium]